MSTHITKRQLLRETCRTRSILRDPFIQQCRSFNLYYSATTKTALGNHKNIPFVPFQYSRKTPFEIELWDFKSSSKIGNMSLTEALDQHIKPGVILLRKRKWVKGEAPRSPEQYVLVKLKTETAPPNVASKHSGQSKARGAKQMFLHTWADMEYCKHKLEAAYHMLKANFRVEFHVGERRLGDKDFRSVGRLFQDLVHLRPEVIQKAMPENTGIIIDPQTDYREYCWVVGPPIKAKGRVTEPKNITMQFHRSRRLQQIRQEQQLTLERTGRRMIPMEKRGEKFVGLFDWKSVKLER